MKRHDFESGPGREPDVEDFGSALLAGIAVIVLIGLAGLLLGMLGIWLS